MFVSGKKTFGRRCIRWVKRKRNLGSIVLAVCTIGSFLWSILGNMNGFPWHFSFSLLVLVLFQGYYCSRYYELKHSRARPIFAFANFHLLAEQARELATHDYTPYIAKAQDGSLDLQDCAKLISKHIDFGRSACDELKKALNASGFKIDRVCLKLEVNKFIFEIANDRGCHYKWDESPIHTEKSIFWRLLSYVHFHYSDLIDAQKLRSNPMNTKLNDKPRFLALEDLDSPTHPESFEAIAALLKSSSPRDFDTHSAAKTMWSDLKQLVHNKYKNCVGVMVCGPALQDPLSEENTNERTRQAIGFFGMDSKDPDILDALEQPLLDLVAAVADSAYAVLANLRIFCQFKLANQLDNPTL